MRFCFILFAAVPLACAAPLEVWVSPAGSDTNPGTEELPLQTLHRARDVVRGFLPSARGDVTVNLGGGTYRLTESLTLDARDSGKMNRSVIWKSAPGEQPVICGSALVPGEAWALVDPALNIYCADVSGLQPVDSRQLYVNGKRAVRARTSDYPAGFRPGVGGIQYVATLLNPAAWFDPLLWENPERVEAVILTQWKNMICGVEAVAPTGLGNGTLVMRDPAWTNANVCYTATSQPGAYAPGIWSFWQVTRFENSLSFLDSPGEWYLDTESDLLYYIPRWGETMATAVVELPVVEKLIEAVGTASEPIQNIRFQGLNFRYATWLGPGSDHGYVTDQSGVYLVGVNSPNIIGHIEPNTIGDPPRMGRSQGNLHFKYARQIMLRDNRFENLGGVAVDFDTGSQRNLIIGNRFSDIASSAIQVGGVFEVDHHPPTPAELSTDNTILNNAIYQTGRDYQDTAAIFVGCTTRTVVSKNTITEVPWSGIALGWGWGLLDPGSFPGLPGAFSGEWGFNETPTATRANRIVNNRIQQFLEVLWDGGAIYTTGQQGTSAKDGTLIAGNVASGKRPTGGGNIFYTDGGSRFVTLRSNVSYDNPIGSIEFGPPPSPLDPLPYDPLPSLANGLPYGGETGGCRTYGQILFERNYWSSSAYFSICPYTSDFGLMSFPIDLSYRKNQIISSPSQVPQVILRNAGFKDTRRP